MGSDCIHLKIPIENEECFAELKVARLHQKLGTLPNVVC